MFKLLYSVVFCLVLLLEFSDNVYSSVLVQDETAFKLSLIHFNDFHARFEEMSSTSTSTKCVPENHVCIGGFPRLYSAIKQLRDEDPDSVLLNAGDDFQGTLWYSFLKWKVIQHFMDMLPLDAHVIGNHEFDDGVQGLMPYLRIAKAPTLVANMDASEEPSLIGSYKDSLIIERKGVKIGLTGVIIKTTNQMASTGKVKFTDEIEAVQRVANDLTSQGVDIIIVISHCGIDIDKEIAAKVKNIDIIVGGHSHTLLYPKEEKPPSGETAVDDYPVVVKHQSGETVLIVQASFHTRYLGNLKVNFDSNGQVKSWTGKPIYLDSSIPQDEKILQAMIPFQEQIEALSGRVLGHSLVKLDRSNNACYEDNCNIGNLLTDAFIEHCVDLAPKGTWTLASIALINIGAITANLDPGAITYERLLLVQPYSNVIQTFNLQGKYLLESLEHSVVRWHRLQVSGLHVVFNMNNEVGKRVESVKVRCSACPIPSYSDLDPEAYYSIVSLAFLVNGGDGYTSISKNKFNVADQGLDVDIIEKYIARHSPLFTEIDGRIKYIPEE